MNFLERNVNSLRPGNLVMELILVTTALGLFCTVYQKAHGYEDAQNAMIHDSAENTLSGGSLPLGYKGDNYTMMIYLVAGIVSLSVCLGAVIGKCNKEFLGGNERFERIMVFLLFLITLVVLCLTIAPAAVENESQDSFIDQNLRYETILLAVAGIGFGILISMSGMYNTYKVLGTSLLLLAAITAWVFIYLAYDRAHDIEGDEIGTTDDRLRRKWSKVEESYLLGCLVLVGFVAVSGILHMVLEKGSIKRLVGTRRSPRRSSPRRKTSPKRKIGTLKPRK